MNQPQNTVHRPLPKLIRDKFPTVRRLSLHVGFWLAYILYDGYLSAPLSGSSFDGLTMWQRFGMTYFAQLCLLAVKVPAVYIVLYYFFPIQLNKKRLLIFGIQVLGVAFISTALVQQIWYHFLYPEIYNIGAPGKPSNIWVALFRWLYNALDILFLLGMAIALKLFRLRQKSVEREKELIEEKLQSELKFLRSQTNPHFLFNTLNNLYHLARKKHDHTPGAILKLSGLLRFMLYECGSDHIDLSQEIKVLHDYIELEKLRYDDRLKLNFKIEIENENAPITPLLLLPLVENAFKHGASENTGEIWIEIILKEKKNALFFSIKNNMDEDFMENKNGIGLNNVKRQLELQYPKHELKIINSENEFLVELNIEEL